MRDFKQIVDRYLHGEFIWDAIPLIPLQLLHLKNNSQNIFFLIKIIRMRRSISKTSILGIIRILAEFVRKYYKDEVAVKEAIKHK